MKKIKWLMLLLLLTGCGKVEQVKEIEDVEQVEDVEDVDDMTISLTQHAQMDEQKTYKVIYEGELVLEVKQDYLINKVCLEFQKYYDDTDIEIAYRGKTYIDGVFKYGKYEVKLDTITGEYYYMGVGANDSFELGFKGNKLTYWLRSKNTATLIINKIYIETGERH